MESMRRAIGHTIHKCRVSFGALFRRQHRVQFETRINAVPHELLPQLPNLIKVLVNGSAVHVGLYE
jgi:hypothetical protein